MTRVSGHQLRATKHALLNSATHNSSFLPHNNRHSKTLDAFLKTTAVTLFLSLHFYKTTREKSLRVRKVGEWRMVKRGMRKAQK